MLDARTSQVRRDLADCQAMHRRVLSAFGDVKAKAARARLGVLYRVESDARTGMTVLLVQSMEQPEWNHLHAQYLAEVDNAVNPACKFIGERYAAIGIGLRLRFRLRANPTRKIDTKTGADGVRRNGKRVELRDEGDQRAWLERKGTQHGFRLRTVQTIDENKRTGNRKARSKGADKDELLPSHEVSGGYDRVPHLTFASVLFDGELVVTDTRLFHEALKNGVGTGKAYGFGLLSVATAEQ
jgi:CRISPR system Cascade subunit CasE